MKPDSIFKKRKKKLTAVLSLVLDDGKLEGVVLRRCRVPGEPCAGG